MAKLSGDKKGVETNNETIFSKMWNAFFKKKENQEEFEQKTNEYSSDNSNMTDEKKNDEPHIESVEVLPGYISRIGSALKGEYNKDHDRGGSSLGERYSEWALKSLSEIVQSEFGKKQKAEEPELNSPKNPENSREDKLGKNPNNGEKPSDEKTPKIEKITENLPEEPEKPDYTSYDYAKSDSPKKKEIDPKIAENLPEKSRQDLEKIMKDLGESPSMTNSSEITKPISNQMQPTGDRGR